MLRLTKKADYALVMLCHMVRSERMVTAKELSGLYSLPVRMTAKILMELSQVGILKGTKGQAGGYTLDVEPEELSLRKLIEIIEGPLELVECIHEQEHCPIVKTCPSKQPLIKLNTYINQSLQSINLKDFATANLYN